MQQNLVAASKQSRRKFGVWTIAVAGLALAGVAQGAWLVYDRAVEHAVDTVGEKVDKTTEKVEEFRKQSQPQWSKAGNAYDPFSGRKSDYVLPEDVDPDPKRNMATKCGETRTFSGNQLWEVPEVPPPSALTPVDLKAQQMDICQRLVAAENMRFNQMMKTMQRIKQRNEALKGLAQVRADIEQSGQLDANSNNLHMFVADAQVEIQYLQATVAAYDSLIVNLKQAQDMLAERGLNGKNPIASAARLAALQLAIQQAKSKELVKTRE
ncbi:MAG: hypothetical protein E6Q88_13460 [Lysobacteraceae bacterium]|nr:MAG: hypothetical protein E6Q88_13460 [Xanthomonadaceae bacterium]